MLRPVSNPPSPWESTYVDWLGEPPEARLEVYEERARSIIAENESPDVGFRYSVNPYRGCFHACAYCLAPDTPILMADGSTKRLGEIRVGDEVYGTVRVGSYRRYCQSRVLARWDIVAPAYRIELEDGTRLIASGDHRFLTERGWKHVTGEDWGSRCRAHLTINNKLMGTGAFQPPPDECAVYRRGYLCGLIRGDGLIGHYVYPRRKGGGHRQSQFRLALIDLEALHRAHRYLEAFDVATLEFSFQEAAGSRKPMRAIRSHAQANVQRIEDLIAWPVVASEEWCRGFLAGIFDAEGSYSHGVLRISNTDRVIVEKILDCLRRFGFSWTPETRARKKPIHAVRLLGGLRGHLRFFHTTSAAISRKRSLDGRAVKSSAPLHVTAIEPLGISLPLVDIQTGTGDFIANGVVSHNCYARPTHQYLGFGAGTDFERKIVVKKNAPELLRKALDRPSWRGDPIVLSGVTDCYQPLEAVYGLTRRCLEVCLEYRNPVGIVTKGALVRRDRDLLAALAREAAAEVFLSIPFADDGTSRKLEPSTSPPSQRFETLRILSEAGIETGVGVAPVIPGLNDSDIAEVLERARDAGARRAFFTLLRLPAEVLPVFFERLREAFPERARKVENAIRDVRGGKLNESAFGARMRGVGPRWEAIEQLFEATCRRLGFNCEEDERPRVATFRRPSAQGMLFKP